MKRKVQGYNSRLDEAIGDRHRKEREIKQTMKDRRDESKGMEKKLTGHAYMADAEMDRAARKHKREARRDMKARRDKY